MLLLHTDQYHNKPDNSLHTNPTMESMGAWSAVPSECMGKRGSCPGAQRAQEPHANLCMFCTACLVGSNSTINLCLIYRHLVLFLWVVVLVWAQCAALSGAYNSVMTTLVGPIMLLWWPWWSVVGYIWWLHVKLICNKYYKLMTHPKNIMLNTKKRK
jgi:hypothetical protein